MKKQRPTLADWQKKLNQGNIPFEGMPVVKEKKKRASEEYHLQISCRAFFDIAWPEYKEDFFHVPNQAVIHDGRIGKFLKDMGRRKGVWDCHLMIARQGYYGMWLEFKSASGSLTDEQIAFRERNQDRYRFEEIKDRKHFIEVMEDYLGKSQRINY